MDIIERIKLDDAANMRRTADGYLVAMPRVARTGIQVYAGHQLGRPDLPLVRVFRPAAIVFAEDTLRTFAHRPVTNDHPPELVTADNWKKYAIGQTGEEVVRDGKYVRVPMVLMDSAAISAVESGKRELSMGYTMDLKWEAGVDDNGESYDAVQTKILSNHLAVVVAARGGPELRIGDDITTEVNDMTEKTLKTMVVDGLTIEVTDNAAQVIQRRMSALEKQVQDAEAEVKARDAKLTEAQKATDAATTELKKALEIKDGEIAALKKNAEDQALTPAKLDTLVKDRSDLITSAQKLAANKLVTDGKSNADIRREVVAARLGEAAVKDRSDDYVQAAFDTLLATPGASKTDPLKTVIGNPNPNTQDARNAAYDEYTKSLGDAWKGVRGSATQQ